MGRAERGLVAGALEKLVVGVRGVEPEDGLARLHEEEEEGKGEGRQRTRGGREDGRWDTPHEDEDTRTRGQEQSLLLVRPCSRSCLVAQALWQGGGSDSVPGRYRRRRS